MIGSSGSNGSNGPGLQSSSSIIQPGTNPDMVDEYELSGVKLDFRQDLGKGWSRVPFRQWTENLRPRLIG